jgi:hypothetical protein
MRTIASLATGRPAAFLFVVRCGINLAMAYGLHLTVEQMSSTMLFTEAVLSLVGDHTTTPNSKLSAHTVTLAKMGERP